MEWEAPCSKSKLHSRACLDSCTWPDTTGEVNGTFLSDMTCGLTNCTDDTRVNGPCQRAGESVQLTLADLFVSASTPRIEIDFFGRPHSLQAVSLGDGSDHYLTAICWVPLRSYCWYLRIDGVPDFIDYMTTLSHAVSRVDCLSSGLSDQDWSSSLR